MSPSSRSSRRWMHATTGIVVVLLTATVLALFLPRIRETIFPPDPTPSPPRCQGTLIEVGTECVGVVTSSSMLHEEIRSVANKILKLNEDVAKSPNYVKVALLTPLSAVENAAMPIGQIRYSLEGAFTALHRANYDRGAVFGDPNAVKMQMLLVNFGSKQEYRDALVQDILRHSEPEHPIVAVVGLGLSFRGTQETVSALAAENIPMVSALASADTLTSQEYPGLHSVSPSNTDYAQALKEFLDRHGETMKLTEGIIVADRNKGDPYVDTLRQAFLENLGTYVHRDPQWFYGGTAGVDATPNVFAPVVERICNAVVDPVAPINMIFYAGRVADFEVFAERLKGRECSPTPLAVLVGATGFQAAESYESVLDDGNLTVIYSSSADAPAWSQGRNGAPEHFPGFHSAFRRHFAEEDLKDGFAIMYYDAVGSAAVAIRAAATGVVTPDPADVELQLNNISVRGASGELSFTDRTNGRAKNKIVVYRQIGGKTDFQLPKGVAPYRTP